MYTADENRYDGRMPIRRAGNKGLQLPAVSFGMWHSFGDEANYKDSEEVILKAFDSGIFSYDLAYNYGPGSGAAERLFGQIYQANLKAHRDELVITTKAGFHMWPGPYGEMSSRKTLINALDNSLTRMGLDYVDIFYSHRFDPNTDPEETAVALDSIVRSGKALYVGISNYTNAQTKVILKTFKELHTPFVVNQLSYNMLNRGIEADGVLDTLKDNHLGMVAYGPLAEGLLTNKYLGGIPEDFQIHWSSTEVMDQGRQKLTQKLNQLNALAQNRNQTLAQMSLAWLLKDPVVVSVVTGASKVSHLEDNLQAVQNINFTPDELAQIESILKA
ncbi:NADP-dependent oxidoreductase domain-containing protein [Secundilactobacillus odoratitofui DSM 19909 = JCM 15043]|uniref:NADP-dependent oxidoreductase domain-containing protein n=1 Tax=Secundilactobacillus odoratitofui DSM 19909 = JCM 15043 TaxID=1423776 RepID=A0A0R1LZB2_9LACO|nr:aldo/keto reductase [Secundilactobacillus odoratitofui]KRK98281.1 NADP-dependent oxidoreductase domain-containing protein [Secundilactobacillus odoratitofui DSM 19909 = JCM 15043]